MSVNKSEEQRAHLFRQLSWEELDTSYLKQQIASALLEDMQGLGLKVIPDTLGDVTTDSFGLSEVGKLQMVARAPMTLCGTRLVPCILDAYGSGGVFQPHYADGAHLSSGEVIGVLTGPMALLLKAERVVLNFVQHLSGIATQTARYVAQLGNSKTRLLDTRKTTPGMRLLEKYAVACGGGWNHRIGLFDRVMLKDNHLAANQAVSGNRLAEAVRVAKAKHPELVIEVEVDKLKQIEPVLEAGADVILLDNFSMDELKVAIALIADKAYTEASGSVRFDTLPQLAELGLDFISCGALTHQSQWQDIGLDAAK